MLANAKIDLDRYEKLAATNAINRQQADTQRALVQQDEALVQADQAAIDNARAMLGYTNIVAPIDGRTGIRMVDEGNIVHASDSPGIVVITQIKPISVFFNLPQQNLAQINTGLAKGALPVDALGSDDNSVIDRGKLTVLDNQVDPTTGTVKLKAEFPNADVQLWPGQFVNVRLLIDTLKQVVVVPTAAVQRGPNGTFVYVVERRQHRQRSGRDGVQAGRNAIRHRQWRDAARTRRHHRLRPPDRRRAGRNRHAPEARRPRRTRGTRGGQRGSGNRRRSKQRQRTAAEHAAMSVSTPFIQRPIATSLLGVAVMLGGGLGYWWLPVSSLPQVDFPTIQVTTQLPGASPDTIAALVTAPLERQFGQIPALPTMTSSSSFGISQITLQFDLSRDIDAAAQDVQAAINAAGSTLPRNLPYPPLYSKVNPADTPIVTLALTSQTIACAPSATSPTP